MMNHFISNPHDEMEHSGAIICSLSVDVDATLNKFFNSIGHLKPKAEKMDTIYDNTKGTSTAYYDAQ